jgi:hypothetical protein
LLNRNRHEILASIHPEPCIGPAERELADGESQNASLIGARSRSAANKRAVSRTAPRARPAGIATSTSLPRQLRSRFHGDGMSRNTAESNMAGYQ